MVRSKKSSLVVLIFVAILINLFGALYYYNHITGQIDEARILYERQYGENVNFNSVFWLCQKIFIGGH